MLQMNTKSVLRRPGSASGSTEIIERVLDVRKSVVFLPTLGMPDRTSYTLSSYCWPLLPTFFETAIG